MEPIARPFHVDREQDQTTPPPAPTKFPSTEKEQTKKTPKPPKPRKVEKRRRGRKS